MSHILEITRPKDVIPDEGDEWDESDYEFAVDCDGVGCDLWYECYDRVHLIKDEDRYDDIIVEHGEDHQMLDDGYCVRDKGCAYQINGMDSESIWEIAEEHGVGRYEVGLDWWEWGVAIIYVEKKL